MDFLPLLLNIWYLLILLVKYDNYQSTQFNYVHHAVCGLRIVKTEK